MTRENENQKGGTGLNPVQKIVMCRNIPDIVGKEIDRIKDIARIYLELRSLLPGYEEGYLDAYEEMANRFDNIGA